MQARVCEARAASLRTARVDAPLHQPLPGDLRPHANVQGLVGPLAQCSRVVVRSDRHARGTGCFENYPRGEQFGADRLTRELRSRLGCNYRRSMEIACLLGQKTLRSSYMISRRSSNTPCRLPKRHVRELAPLRCDQWRGLRGVGGICPARPP